MCKIIFACLRTFDSFSNRTNWTGYISELNDLDSFWFQGNYNQKYCIESVKEGKMEISCLLVALDSSVQS